MHLKSITAAGVPAALEKARRYRLLNESVAAESICLDILAVDPGNHEAMREQLLAVTDQFATDADAPRRARELLPKLATPYEQAYYAGIISERRARARLDRAGLGATEVAAEGLHEAMRSYEEAEKLRPAGNDDAILRWNTCARLLERHEPDVKERQDYIPALED